MSARETPPRIEKGTIYPTYVFGDTSSVSKSPRLSPRYKITSPSNGGFKTESIRELTIREAESLIARGYTVQQVSENIGLRSAIQIRPQIPYRKLFKRVKWRKINPRSQIRKISGPAIVKRNKTKVSSALRLFQETVDSYQFSESLESYWHVERSRYVRLRPSSAAALRRRSGWTLIRRNPPVETGISGARNDRSSSSSGSSTPSSYTTSQNPSTTQYSTSQDAYIQELRQELQNQKDWIERINSRLSQQMTDMGNAATSLGESTTQRSQEIQRMDQWSQDNIRRIDETLVQLGNAVSDVAKSVSIKKAEDTVNQVGKNISSGGNDVLGGIGSFFTNPSNIILIVIVVVLLVMIKK